MTAPSVISALVLIMKGEQLFISLAFNPTPCSSS